MGKLKTLKERKLHFALRGERKKLRSKRILHESTYEAEHQPHP